MNDFRVRLLRVEKLRALREIFLRIFDQRQIPRQTACPSLPCSTTPSLERAAPLDPRHNTANLQKHI